MRTPIAPSRHEEYVARYEAAAQKLSDAHRAAERKGAQWVDENNLSWGQVELTAAGAFLKRNRPVCVVIDLASYRLGRAAATTSIRASAPVQRQEPGPFA